MEKDQRHGNIQDPVMLKREVFPLGKVLLIFSSHVQTTSLHNIGHQTSQSILLIVLACSRMFSLLSVTKREC